MSSWKLGAERERMYNSLAHQAPEVLLAQEEPEDNVTSGHQLLSESPTSEDSFSIAGDVYAFGVLMWQVRGRRMGGGRPREKQGEHRGRAGTPSYTLLRTWSMTLASGWRFHNPHLSVHIVHTYFQIHYTSSAWVGKRHAEII